VSITLYDAPRCPFCARTRIVLAEKGVPYETVAIDLDDRPAWVVERNPPDGRVPILEEDGWVLPESVVIDEYLEERYPDPPLLPADPGERAVARLLVFRFDETLGDPYYAYRREGAGAADWLALGLGQLEAMLGAAPFLTGARFGLADVSYIPWLLRLRGLLGVSLDSYPAISGWLVRCADRPSIAAEIETVSALA
jgi:glutathione S-transferase